MSADTAQLLMLLREAGDEAVTLDELAIAGVRDPAGALRRLEDAGHAVQRVRERPAHGRAVMCVRLAAPSAGLQRDVPASTPAPATPARRAPAPPARRLLAATAVGVLLLVLARALSRRRA
jgi:hypothetical protein